MLYNIYFGFTAALTSTDEDPGVPSTSSTLQPGETVQELAASLGISVLEAAESVALQPEVASSVILKTSRMSKLLLICFLYSTFHININSCE